MEELNRSPIQGASIDCLVPYAIDEQEAKIAMPSLSHTEPKIRKYIQAL